MAHPPHLSALLRAAVPTAAIALALAATPTLAHSEHHHGHTSATGAAAATSTPATKRAPGSGSGSATTPVPTTAAAPSMWTVADPKRPRIASGPRGPLWSSYVPREVGTTAMGLTFAERILAIQAAKASERRTNAEATRAALTTAQATKKLTKKCQKLVKITKAKDLKKLKKADRKARTKCLEQRRKLIANSKKKPETRPGTSSPSPPAPTGPSTPTTPSSPEPNTPTTPSPTTPAATTPTTPAGCTTPGLGDTLAVTALDEGAQFELSSCGLKAGTIKFAFDTTDASEEHNFVVTDGYHEVTDAGQTSSRPTGTMHTSAGPLKPGQPGKTVSATLKAGDYWLICTVAGHVAMATKFRVFAA